MSKGRKALAHVFAGLIAGLMIYMQYQQYVEVSSKTIKNIIVLAITAISISQAAKKANCFPALYSKILLLLVYIFVIQILTNTFSIETYYYAYVAFVCIIGGVEFSDIYYLDSVKNKIRVLCLILYIISISLFIYFFNLIGFRGAGVQTSIAYPLCFFLFVSLLYDYKIVLLSALPLMYGGFVLMLRTIVLLTLILCALNFFCKQSSKEHVSNNMIKRVVAILIIVVAIIELFNYVTTIWDVNILHKATLRGSDFTSGRSRIYEYTLKMMFEQNFVNILFGNGASTVVKWVGISAHSDIIEFAVDYGLIGCALFLSILYSCAKACITYRYYHLALIEISFFVLYIAINQMFLSVGVSVIYGFFIGIIYGGIQNGCLIE